MYIYIFYFSSAFNIHVFNTRTSTDFNITRRQYFSLSSITPCTWSRKYTYTNTHIYIRTYVRACVCVCAYVCIYNTHQFTLCTSNSYAYICKKCYLNKYMWANKYAWHNISNSIWALNIYVLIIFIFCTRLKFLVSIIQKQNGKANKVN